MSNQLPILGWREWVALPGLNLPPIKAKIDTGARTSALHAFFVEPYTQDNQEWVRFGIHPHQHDNDQVIECHAPIKDQRVVSDSGGNKQQRYVIETQLVIGTLLYTAEITLTNRDTMRFRMLLGRTAMNGRFIINPASSYQRGKPKVAR